LGKREKKKHRATQDAGKKSGGRLEGLVFQSAEQYLQPGPSGYAVHPEQRETVGTAKEVTEPWRKRARKTNENGRVAPPVNNWATRSGD